MAQGDLSKAAWLINDEEFRRRCAAAQLLHAQAQIASTTAKNANYATWVMVNPMAMESSMVAMVATDPTVLSQTSVVDGKAELSGLQDSAITAVVANKWGVVANKYPTSPLQQ